MPTLASPSVQIITLDPGLPFMAKLTPAIRAGPSAVGPDSSSAMSFSHSLSPASFTLELRIVACCSATDVSHFSKSSRRSPAIVCSAHFPSPITLTSLLKVTKPTFTFGLVFFSSWIYDSIAACTHSSLDTYVTWACPGIH